MIITKALDIYQPQWNIKDFFIHLFIRYCRNMSHQIQLLCLLGMVKQSDELLALCLDYARVTCIHYNSDICIFYSFWNVLVELHCFFKSDELLINVLF